jgi:hypothetical protein
MKKKFLLTLIALGVFFISSCEGIQDLLDDNPRNLGFVQKGLKAGAATAGVTAGSLSAEGGNGALYYSLIPGVGAEDNEFFALEGTALKITAESLDQYDYSFRVKVEDGKGQSVEDTFFLTVGPPDGSGETEDPDAPNVPGVPGGENPNEGGGTDDPDDPGEGENSGEQAVGKPERVGTIVSKLDMQRIHLSWDAADRAASYEVRYSEGKNLALATKFATEPTEPAVTVTGLIDGTAYNFWVVAKNSSGSAMASNMHSAKRISDPIPEYLLYGSYLANGAVAYFKSSNAGDAYPFQDRGEAYPAHERYCFAYGGMDGMYPGETIAFVRCLTGSDTESYSGVNGRGCLIYRYTKNGQDKFHATYYYDSHLYTPKKDYQGFYSTPPAAVMAQANGYTSGMDASATNTLQEAIEKFANQAGFTNYQTPMRIYYGYVPGYVPK